MGWPTYPHRQLRRNCVEVIINVVGTLRRLNHNALDCGRKDGPINFALMMANIDGAINHELIPQSAR
jgi:hypothetical protein